MRRWMSVVLMTGLVLAAGLAPVEAKRLYIPMGSSDSGSGGSLIWVILGMVVVGGGAFRLLRKGAGLAVRGAQAVTRSSAAPETSDWAERVNNRLGPVAEHTQPSGQQPMQKVLTPGGDGPRRGTTVVASGPKRSAGFGGSRSASSVDQEPAPATVAPAAPAAPVAAVATTAPPAAVPAPRPAAAIPAALRAPRQARLGGAAPRAQFGTKRA